MLVRGVFRHQCVLKFKNVWNWSERGGQHFKAYLGKCPKFSRFLIIRPPLFLYQMTPSFYRRNVNCLESCFNWVQLGNLWHFFLKTIEMYEVSEDQRSWTIFENMIYVFKQTSYSGLWKYCLEHYQTDDKRWCTCRGWAVPS